MIKRRIAKFTVNFPDAIELMVRGLRSGLPITETLGIVASEIPGPVGVEFRARVRQDEDRPDDGGRASGNRRPPRHARIPVLRHHAGDPARDRRQPCRDAVEPRRRAAQARADEAQDPRDELGIEGLGLHRRLAAVHRLRARLDGQPRLPRRLLHRRAADRRRPGRAAAGCRSACSSWPRWSTSRFKGRYVHAGSWLPPFSASTSSGSRPCSARSPPSPC